MNEELLKRLPENTVAVFEWDLSRDSYKSFVDSPWFAFDSFAQISEGLDAEAEASLKRAGITIDSKMSFIQNGAAFLTGFPQATETDSERKEAAAF